MRPLPCPFDRDQQSQCHLLLPTGFLTCLFSQGIVSRAAGDASAVFDFAFQHDKLSINRSCSTGSFKNMQKCRPGPIKLPFRKLNSDLSDKVRGGYIVGTYACRVESKADRPLGRSFLSSHYAPGNALTPPDFPSRRCDFSPPSALSRRHALRSGERARAKRQTRKQVLRASSGRRPDDAPRRCAAHAH